MTEPSGHTAPATLDRRPETRQALGVASWTLVSRVSGLVRVAVAGATLGPTFFANIFQATNTVPNITYNLMAGSLLTTLVVPTLVEEMEHGGLARARAVAEGLLGVVIAGFCAAGLLVLALGPVIVHLLTIGVTGPDARPARFQAWVLLLLVVPQILLYGIAALGIAAQNARGRFLLASAAPTVENLGLIVALLLGAHLYGGSLDGGAVPSGYLMVLGAGATLSVAAHAGLQVFGAARAGLPLRPRWGWSDPAVRGVARRAVPAMGTASLDAGGLFALIVAAGTIPGGVVAFQIGLNFYNLPLAISARAVGTVSLPGLARDAVRGRLDRFARGYTDALSTTWFVAVPAAIALLLLGRPIAQALSFGKLQQGDGIELVAVSVVALAPALLGGATNEIARQASYARQNVMAPLLAGLVQVALILAGIVVSVRSFDGAATLIGCGVSVAIANLAQSLVLDRSVRRDLPSLPSRARGLLRHALVSAVTIVPAALGGRMIASTGAGRLTTMIGVAGGTLVGLVAYVSVQRILRAPEVMSFGRKNPKLARSLAFSASQRANFANNGWGWSDLVVVVAAAAVAVIAGAVSLVGGAMVPAAIAAIALFALVAARPTIAAYLYLAALPFVTGITRGTLIPLLRPNEALQAFLTAAVVAGLCIRYLRDQEAGRLTITRLDRALVLLATLASVWPLAWELARSQMPTSADVMSTVPLWRFVGLYALYRFAIRDNRQLRRCVQILLAGAMALSVIATLQSLDLVSLGSLWAPDNPSTSGGRGYSTLSSAIAVGDYLACCLAVTLAWILRSRKHRPWLYVIAAVLILGSLGSGQFSAWIGAAIVVVLVAAHEQQLRRLAARAAPLVLVGVALTWPVVGRRLGGFNSNLGVPSSWVGRIDNLTHFFLPRLGGFNWVFGVRPDSVLPAPETWREVIYLESGVLWFLWVGGIPLLLGAIWFFRVAMRHTRTVAGSRFDEVGVMGLATWAGLWVFAVLSLIDMHLTLRGAGDLLFIMLGLSAVRFVTPEPEPVTRLARATPPLDHPVMAVRS